MNHDKNCALTGACNKRLNNVDQRNMQSTFPLADTESIKKNSQFTIPAIEDVVHAKEWIDDGSQL